VGLLLPSGSHLIPSPRSSPSLPHDELPVAMVRGAAAAVMVVVAVWSSSSSSSCHFYGVGSLGHQARPSPGPDLFVLMVDLLIVLPHGYFGLLAPYWVRGSSEGGV
jgi:hypothetical protein